MMNEDITVFKDGEYSRKNLYTNEMINGFNFRMMTILID